jgi:hypothetical protein
MFFRPEIVDSKYSHSIVQMLDNTIQMSPIDCRRKLYNNIILSGGSTSVSGLHQRLDRELKTLVNDRLEKYASEKGMKPAPIDINIYSSPYKNFAVWNGGSMLAIHVDPPYPRTTFTTTITNGKITGRSVPRLLATTRSSPSTNTNRRKPARSKPSSSA